MKKEKILCVGCDEVAKYKCCEEDYCFECLCTDFEEDIIAMLKEKYDMYEIN